LEIGISLAPRLEIGDWNLAVLALAPSLASCDLVLTSHMLADFMLIAALIACQLQAAILSTLIPPPVRSLAPCRASNGAAMAALAHAQRSTTVRVPTARPGAPPSCVK
jgi:hypothetical protein